MLHATTQATIIYGLAIGISMLVALLIKGLFSALRRYSGSDPS